MKTRFVVVPDGALPEGTHAVVVEGEETVCMLMSEGSTLHDIAADLTEAVQEHADRSWLHRAAFGWDKVLTHWGESDHDGSV